MARIKIGATTWANPSLVASGWYPAWARTPEERLRYYATQFPLVENDATYYAVPDRAAVERWRDRTPPDFTMNVKAFAPLTGHYTDPRRLPADLRDALPPALLGKPRVYPDDLGEEILGELVARFRDGIAPLHAAGKLGLVLLQYPVWFPRARATEAELLATAERLRPFRVAVEFRNATWMAEDHAARTLAMLRAHDLVYTCVDEPQGFPSSVPPIAAATSEVALVRMHGRNGARWDKKARSAEERFSWIYTPAELREWAVRVVGLARETREVQVLFNNCHADYAVRNARQMQELLEGVEIAPSPSPSPSLGGA